MLYFNLQLLFELLTIIILLSWQFSLHDCKQKVQAKKLQLLTLHPVNSNGTCPCMHGNTYMDVSLHILAHLFTDTLVQQDLDQTPVCHFNVKGVQINQISELSDEIHYLASQLYTIMFLHITVGLRGRLILLHMLIAFLHSVLRYNKSNNSKHHTGISFITWFCRKSSCPLGF